MFDWLQDAPLFNLCTDFSFIISRIPERLDVLGKWFNASIKLIKKLCMILVLAMMGHILNWIFKWNMKRMRIKLSLKSKTLLKKEMKKIEIHFENYFKMKQNLSSVLILNWMWKNNYLRNKNLLQKELGLDGPP